MIKVCTETGSVYEIENKTIRKVGHTRRTFVSMYPERPEVGKRLRVFYNDGSSMLTSEVTFVSE